MYDFLILIPVLVGFFLGLLVILVLQWITTPWTSPWKPEFKPGIHGAMVLNKLRKSLLDVHYWLSSADTGLMKRFRDNLWKQIRYIEIERLNCITSFAPDIKDKLWALRQLSERAEREAKEAIKAIANDPNGEKVVQDEAIRLLTDSLEDSESATPISKVSPRINGRPGSERKPETGVDEPSQIHEAQGQSPLVLSRGPTFINMKGVSMGEKGDIYHVGQGGIVGPNAHAHDITFNQIWNKAEGTIDLPRLSEELAVLRQEMKKAATEPEHDIAIGTIAAAEQAAKTGNGPKTLELLASAGKWALSVAEKIGIGVAIAAIKNSLGS